MAEVHELDGHAEAMETDGNAEENDGLETSLEELFRDGIKDQLIAEEIVSAGPPEKGFLLPSRNGSTGPLHFAVWMASFCLPGKTGSYNMVL